MIQKVSNALQRETFNAEKLGSFQFFSVFYKGVFSSPGRYRNELSELLEKHIHIIYTNYEHVYKFSKHTKLMIQLMAVNCTSFAERPSLSSGSVSHTIESSIPFFLKIRLRNTITRTRTNPVPTIIAKTAPTMAPVDRPSSGGFGEGYPEGAAVLI